METIVSKERVVADVRHHCKQLGLSHNQTRAAVNAALNHYARQASDLPSWELEAVGQPLPIVQERLEGRAISEGRHVAGQFAEGGGHG